MAVFGADVAQLKALGIAMQSRAEDIRQLVTTLESNVGATTWQGPDADRFRNDWSSNLRNLMVQVASELEAAGRNAQRQAGDQEQASSAGATSGSGSGDPYVSASTGSGTSGGAPAGSSPDGGEDSEAATAAYAGFYASHKDVKVDYDHAYGVQCVDLVNSYAQELFGTSAYSTLGAVAGANELYASASGDYFEKLAVGTTPQPGDIVCVGSNTYSPTYGHVAIVNEVRADGSYSVFQQNGATQEAAYVGNLSQVETSAVQGFLRPRVSKLSQ